MSVFVGSIELNLRDNDPKSRTISITVPEEVRADFKKDLSVAMQALPQNNDLRTIVAILFGMMSAEKK